MVVVLAIILVCIGAVYFWVRKCHTYWESRGVPGPRPTFLVGNIGESLLLKKSTGEVLTEIYRNYPNSPMIGTYDGIKPTIMIRDPELIKEVMLRSFKNFHDNGIDADKDLDPLFSRNPFFLNGEDWKSTRALLTPNFTSGKMKAVYPLIEETSKQLVNYITNEPDATNGNGLDAKEISTKFTLNNVASCAFGLDGKCFEDPNSEFRDLARRFFQITGWSMLQFYLVFLIPSLARFLKIKLVPKDVEDQIQDMVTQTLKYRKENNIVRNDFLHIMNQLKEQTENFTDVDVAAHAAGFFSDGFETSSQAMSFVLYHLANNPEVQSTLRQEIVEAFKRNEDSLPYEVLQELTYVDAVICESLRIHPPFYNLIKRCTSDYIYTAKSGEGLNKATVTIEKETSVILPIYALHNDPKYYEEPDSFKPERFLGKNRDKLVKYTYMPFGEGPRACLGQRFGTMQIKAGLAYTILNFELSVNEKTQRPLKFDPANFFLVPIGGLWLDFKKID